MSSLSSLDSLLNSSSAGVDISNILQAAMGAATPGIDVTSAVNAGVTAAEAPENNWESQQTTLQNQTTALNSIQTDATNLDSDAQALNSLTGAFSAATVDSSNSSVITGSAAPGAKVGNNIVVVNDLATTASWSSSAVASETTDLPAESFTITAAGGATQTFTTGSGVNTLSDLSSAINSAGLGVTSSLIQDATGYRLAITSNTSGSAGSFTVSGPNSGLEFTQGSAGANASLTVNGISFSSASNTVTGAIPGVTLNLQSASPGSEVSLDVAPGTGQASDAINQFVSDYNTLITALNSQFSDTNGAGQGVLADDPAVRNLQSELLGALDYTASPASGSTTTTVPNLSSLGIAVNTDGTLTVNSATLDTALQNTFSDVQNFFQGSSLNGFANSLDQQLTSFVSPADGAFTVDLRSMSSEYTTLQADISNFQTNVIAPLKTQLQSEYSQAEISLQELPSEIRNVDAELGQNSNSSGG